MSSAVPQIVLGLLLIVAGILVVKAAENDLGWILFVAGAALAVKGGIQISKSGMAELGN